jgi:hypothetical protein
MTSAQGGASGAQHPRHHNTCAAGKGHPVFVLWDCRAPEEGACPTALGKVTTATCSTRRGL